ncbi:MAG: phage major tail protein, TP901-1 family [Alphaproteobacteria bacterium]
MAELGRLFLLKIGAGDGPPETFSTVAGLNTTSLTINNETVDVTTKDDVGWRTLLAGASFRTMSVSGNGIIQSAANKQQLVDNALDGSIDNYEMTFEDGAKFTGAFQVTSVELSGEHNGALTYSISLESSGAVTFAAGS